MAHRQRRRLQDAERLNADYLWNGGEAKLEEDRTELKTMKCLAVTCHESKAAFAHAIAVKGRDEDNFVAGFITTDVEFHGPC